MTASRGEYSEALGRIVAALDAYQERIAEDKACPVCGVVSGAHREPCRELLEAIAAGEVLLEREAPGIGETYANKAAMECVWTLSGLHISERHQVIRGLASLEGIREFEQTDRTIALLAEERDELRRVTGTYGREDLRQVLQKLEQARAQNWSGVFAWFWFGCVVALIGLWVWVRA